MTQHIGPRTEEGDLLHSMKYRGEGESYREAMNRLAFGLKDSDRHYHELRDILYPMRFLFGGRIQSAIGGTRQVTAYNCFVSGVVEDSFVDGAGSIMQRAHEAASTLRLGGGIGYDFSKLRPKGDLIRKLQVGSAGPMPFMGIFNAVCNCVRAAGYREGAQMGTLRVDHPDIEDFIRVKQNEEELRRFNLSVSVTDEFMRAVQEGDSFNLRFKGEVYRTVDAQALWEMIMRSTWDWAEPGVQFIDRVNEMNNLWYCEEIATSNPCSEQFLPPYGACLLGSFNLTRYLVPASGIREAGEPNWTIDLDQLRADIPPIVRAMDNVIDRALYPLPAQRAEAITKRRMGLGVAGLANAIEATGRPYGTPDFLSAEAEILSIIRDESYRASARLASEKGTFPLYDPERYLAGAFVSTLSEDIKEEIGRYGMRNSHLTSIQPTGTISMTADNISSGIEPVFSYEVTRPINTPDGTKVVNLMDYGAAFLDTRGRLASNVTAQEHLGVLAQAQRHVDSAVSKTINMDGRTMPWSDFKDIYLHAWEMGCKSVATFNISGKRGAMMQGKEQDEGAACAIDPVTGRMECA